MGRQRTYDVAVLESAPGVEPDDAIAEIASSGPDFSFVNDLGRSAESSQGAKPCGTQSLTPFVGGDVIIRRPNFPLSAGLLVG